MMATNKNKTSTAAISATTESNNNNNDLNPNDENNNNDNNNIINIYYIHLDLGIGGAEQLILNLAEASLNLKHNVKIITSKCNQNHCFSQVNKNLNGILCNNVYVYGTFIPTNILGYGTVVFSTIRMLYISYILSYNFFNNKKSSSSNKEDSVIVLDVLPTPIPFLLYVWGLFYKVSILFYCHYPDKLLKRDTINGYVVPSDGDNNDNNDGDNDNDNSNDTTTSANTTTGAKSIYRNIMGNIEEQTMYYSDMLVVNSKFTQSQVERVFPTLCKKDINVLYPALDVSKFNINTNNNSDNDTLLSKNQRSIVSLNRFERKKNIQLLLYAYSELRDILIQERYDITKKLPPLIIAGGYDIDNIENVEYMIELKKIAFVDLDLPKNKITFKPNITDEERSNIMSPNNALCIVYTPHLEHFGIVPIEAMYAKCPIIAVNSGGPKESIIHEKTGWLCDNNSNSFCYVLHKLVTKMSNDEIKQIGLNGHNHVINKFGINRFQYQYNELIKKTIKQGNIRKEKAMNTPTTYKLLNSFIYLLEGLFILVFVMLLTYILKSFNIIKHNESILGSIRNVIIGNNDEL